MIATTAKERGLARRDANKSRTNEFRDRQRDMGYKELRHLLCSGSDLPYVDTLINSLNLAREQELEDESDILFRIDNISATHSTTAESLHVIVNRQRVQIPVPAIKPGGAFLLRRGQLESLIYESLGDVHYTL